MSSSALSDSDDEEIRKEAAALYSYGDESTENGAECRKNVEQPYVSSPIANFLNGLPEWSDDLRMRYLFSNSPVNRHLNVDAWDRRHAFWEGLIIHCAQEGWLPVRQSLSSAKPSVHVVNFPCCVLDRSLMPSAFIRNGLMPLCLEIIIDEMQKNGKLVPLQHFLLPSQESILHIGSISKDTWRDSDDLFVVLPLIKVICHVEGFLFKLRSLSYHDGTVL